MAGSELTAVRNRLKVASSLSLIDATCFLTGFLGLARVKKTPHSFHLRSAEQVPEGGRWGERCAPCLQSLSLLPGPLKLPSFCPILRFWGHWRRWERNCRNVS